MCSSEDTRVLIAYAPSRNSEEATTSKLDGKFVHLLNPKTGSKALYMITADSVQEVHWFKERYGSWFVGDFVIEDGSLYLASPVDPIFLLLPMLDTARMKSQKDDDQGKYRALDDILDVEGYPSYSLLSPLLQTCLQSVCDVREIGPTKYYRLEDNKTLAWLFCKVKQAYVALKSLGDGSYASLSKDELVMHAVGLLGEYLKPDPWFKRLCDELRVDFQACKKARTESQPNLFSAVEIKVAPVTVPAASNNAGPSKGKSNATKKPPPTGNRKITSFFGRPR